MSDWKIRQGYRAGDESREKNPKLPDVETRLDSAGFEPIGNAPAQFGAYIRSAGVRVE